MAVYGADVEQLRSLAQRMAQSADRLENEVISSTGHLIAQSPWQGADASEFRQQWNQQLVPLIRRSAGNLRQCENTLLNNARQQEETSSADGGGYGGTSGYGGTGGSSRVQGLAATTHGGSIGATADSNNGIDIWGTMSWITDKLGDVSGLADLDKFASWVNTALNLPGADASKFLDDASLFGVNAALSGSLVGKFLDGAGYIGLTMDGFKTLKTLFESSANPFEKATSVFEFGASVAQTSKNPVAYLGGTAVKTAIMIGKEAAKIDHTLPEGVTFLEAVAGKQELSDNPVVAAAEVVSGGAQHLWNATCKVFGGIFG